MSRAGCSKNEVYTREDGPIIAAGKRQMSLCVPRYHATFSPHTEDDDGIGLFGIFASFVCVCVCVCVCAHAFVHVWAYMCEPLPVCLYVYATDTMPVVNVCMCARVGLCTCVPGVHLYVPYRHYGRCNIQQTRP